ncbi:MAG: protein phosphatase 2C domain-containing protein [Candidatus Sedimenticola endophacoides]
MRERNEDSVAVLPEFGLVVLGDGMGGHHAGEVASQIVVESVSVSLMAAFPGLGGEVLEEAVAGANRALFSAMDEAPGLQGMGSTVVAGAFDGQWLHYTHVGDSRLLSVSAPYSGVPDTRSYPDSVACGRRHVQL